MLNEYTLSDFISAPSIHIAYYANYLEAIEEPEMKWPYRQSFYSIIWFTQGEGLKVIDFNEYQIQQGRIFLLAPDQINNWSYTRNCKGYTLMFAKSLASQLGIEFRNTYIDIEKHDVSILSIVFEYLIKDCKLNENELQNKIITSIRYLYSLITDQVSDELINLNRTAVFRQFKKLVLINDCKIQSTNKYADTLHISIDKLNEICQNSAGISAKQLLLDLKITEAKRLLLYSNLNISEISFQLGFEDASYFARIFKKKTLLSPSAFFKKYRK